MTDLATIQELSVAGRHQECLQACQNDLQSNPDQAYAYKYAGKSLLALGQFEKAQQCLGKAHQLDSNDPETAKDIGNIFLNLGNKEAALGWYEKALVINNNYAPAFNNLANLKRQLGNTQEAIDLFKRALELDPKLIQPYIGAALSFMALGDLDQAASFANQTLAINNSAKGVNEILGIVYQNKGNSEQAIECYQKELEVNPQARNSLLNLGLLLLQKGQAAAAVESLAKASALTPSEQCSLLLAQAYQKLGQFKEAIDEYKKLDINQSKNKLVPFNLGLCLLNTGNNIDAIEAFKIAVEIDEKLIGAWGNIGTAFMNEGRHQEALAATQKVLDLDPDNPTAHMNMGGIYKDLGNLDQALASTLQSLKLKPDNPDAHMNMGGIYKDLGNLDQALASTLQSLNLKPDNPTAHMNLGGIYKDLGNLDQALVSTLRSLELKPDNPDANMNLGLVYKELGQLDQALASTLRSLELKPDNPTAHMNLGGIYFDRSEYKDAEQEIDLAIDQNPSKLDAYFCYRLKSACLFRKKDYNKVTALLEELLLKNLCVGKSLWETHMALSATSYAREHEAMKAKLSRSNLAVEGDKKDSSLVVMRNRPVEEDLLRELRTIKFTKLSQTKTNDARNGNGLCTNFELFQSNSSAIKKLSKDLIAIASKALSKDIASLKYDSFFNIFKSGAGTTPHRHISSHDKKFNLWQHKYSLVYYLDPGDQDCKNPGFLKMYNPDIEILPEKGMIVIIPATRAHSSYYDGSKSRLMIGVNFYAFPRH